MTIQELRRQKAKIEREIERKEQEALEDAIHGLPRRTEVSDKDKVWAYDRLHRTLKNYLRHAVQHGYWADDSNDLLIDMMIVAVMGDEGAAAVWEIIEKVQTQGNGSASHSNSPP